MDAYAKADASEDPVAAAAAEETARSRAQFPEAYISTCQIEFERIAASKKAIQRGGGVTCEALANATALLQ